MNELYPAENERNGSAQQKVERIVELGFWRWFARLCVQSIETLEISTSAEPAPYIKISTVLIGMGMMFASLMTNPVVELGLIGKIAQIFFGGILAALIHYYLHGSIFHLLILLSGGKGSVGSSRRLYIYANLPGHIGYFAAAFLQLILFRFSHAIWAYEVVGFAWIFAAILLMVFQIKLFFTGAVMIQKARPVLGFVLFFLIPVLYSIFIVIDTFASLALYME